MKNLLLRATSSLAVLSACAVMAAPAYAQDEAPSLSYNVAVTNDYVWRGFSQSDEDVAFQGGIDFAAGNVYAGTWASTVDFGDDTDAEWDFYAGVTGTAGVIDWDVAVTFYTYVNAPSGADYNFVEFKAAASHTIDNLTLGAAIHYSPDFYGADETATYVEVNGEYAFNNRFSLSGGLGRQTLDVGDDYNSWNLGLGVNLTEIVSLDVRYWDASVDGPLSDARLAATLGVAF